MCFVLCPQIFPTSIQHLKQDDCPNVHVSIHVSSFNIPGFNPSSLQWWAQSFNNVIQQTHVSFISFVLSIPVYKWAFLIRNWSFGVLEVKCVTKGTVAIHACCRANHSSMWSLEIAAVQCHCVYRVFLCDVLGAEPVLGASSALHHAAPSKNKLFPRPQLSLSLSLFSLFPPL